MGDSKDLNLNADHERSFFFWLSFVFQSFFSEYVFSLLRIVPFSFFSFFFEHAVPVYNIFCLLSFHGHSLAYYKRILVKVLWRPTKIGWGKKIPLERLELGSLLFLGMFQSLSILEVQGYGSIHFTFFNTGFFYKPPPRRIFYLVNRLWWYGLSFFLYAKSYLYHLAMVRYNHYVEGAFAGVKPLLRAASISKFRLLERHTSKDFKSYIQESFGIFLYAGRFVFFKDRVKNESTTKYRTFKTRFYITEGLEADANIVAPYWRWAGSTLHAEDFYDSLLFSYRFWIRHKSIKALSDLHIRYVNSAHFWLHSFYYYFYFVHRYIQRGPKKYDFTYSWVKCWVSLPFIGSLWSYLYKEFMGQFMKDLSARYLAFLLGSDGFFDVNLTEAWWVSLDCQKSFFDLWHSFHYEVRFLDYNREELSRGPTASSGFLSNWEITYDHLKGLSVFFHAAPVLRFLMSRLFGFSAPSDVLPFSYPFFIFWKATHFYIFTELGPKEEGILFYFKRLHLDAFFFSRLRYFAASFDTTLYTIELATYDEFLEHIASLKDDPLGDHKPVPPKGEIRFKLHILFFFFLRDFFFKKAFLSRLMPLYLFLFSLGDSPKRHRGFFLDFGFSQVLKFRTYFAGLFLDQFAAPAEDEPIVYYDPVHHRALRGYYWRHLDRTEQRAVMAMGKARGFHTKTKWFPLIPAFTASMVEVWYMDEPSISSSNWEYALAGLRLPEPRFLEGYLLEEQGGVLELRLSFYFMVFGR